MAKQQKPPMDEQREGQSSFGRPLGEDHGQSGTPLEGELSNGARPGRLDVDQDNAIPSQTKAKRHNSGSRAGQD